MARRRRRGRGAPSRAASERARVRRPTWRRGVGRGSRSRYGRSVSRTLGAEILHPWENPVRPRTLAPLSPRRAHRAQRRSTSWPGGPTRLAAGPDARRGRPRREPVSRQPNSRILRSTRLNRVLTEIRIESDDCWDDVRRRPKREHFYSSQRRDVPRVQYSPRERTGLHAGTPHPKALESLILCCNRLRGVQRQTRKLVTHIKNGMAAGSGSCQAPSELGISAAPRGSSLCPSGGTRPRMNPSSMKLGDVPSRVVGDDPSTEGGIRAVSAP